MDLEKVRLSLVKYKMDKFQLIIPSLSEPYEVQNDLITNIILDFDYEDYWYPFFEIDITIPTKIYREMRKNNLNLKAYIKLQKGYFKNSILSDTSSIPVFSDYINDTFYIFMEDMSPDLTEDRQRQLEKTGEDFGAMSHVKLLVYNYEYYNNTSGVVNTVLTSATLVDALIYVLNKASINKVLLSPPTNYKTYPEFILTPIPIIDQIDRICNQYGMHKSGTLIFFDLKQMYIIDKGKKCTAYQNNENKITYLISSPIGAEGSIVDTGCYKDDGYNVINMNANTVSCKSLTELNDNIYANGYATINANGGVNTTLTNSVGKISKVYVVNNGDDTSSALENTLSDETKLFVCGFSSVDLDMLTPNKQFIVSIDDVKQKTYNGKYRLVRTVVTFVKEGDYFNPVISCSLKG